MHQDYYDETGERLVAMFRAADKERCAARSKHRKWALVVALALTVGVAGALLIRYGYL